MTVATSGGASGSATAGNQKITKWLVGGIVATLVVILIAFVVSISNSDGDELTGPTPDMLAVEKAEGGDSATNAPAPAPAPSPQAVAKAELEDGVVATLSEFGQTAVLEFNEKGFTGWVRYPSSAEVTAYDRIGGRTQTVAHSDQRSGWSGAYVQYERAPDSTLEKVRVELTRLGDRRKERR